MFGYNSLQWEFWLIVLGIPLVVYLLVFAIRMAIQEERERKAALKRVMELREENWEEYLKEGKRYLETYRDPEPPKWLNPLNWFKWGRYDPDANTPYIGSSN